MMRAHKEALEDLHETPAWPALMKIAMESTAPFRKQLLVSTNIPEINRIETIGRMQGVYKFFQAVAKEMGYELPSNFIEHFTGEKPE